MNNNNKFQLLIIFLFTAIFSGCIKYEKIEVKDTPITQHIDKSSEISSESIFNLTTKWQTQNNDTISLRNLQGKVLVIVMIYTSCKSACPRLVADMRAIESQMPKEKLPELNFVLVSIDPDNDTPKHLKAFAKDNHMEAPHWTFLQGTESSVQEFANVLAVKYKQISPIDFSHSNIISVFNREGVLVHQQEGLGVNNKETVQKILLTLQK